LACGQSEVGSPGRTTGAQNPPESKPNFEQTKVKFPKLIQNKKSKVEVTIYGKSKGGERKQDGGVTQPYPFYRPCWRVAGQRRMKSFGAWPRRCPRKPPAKRLIRLQPGHSEVLELTSADAHIYPRTRDPLTGIEVPLDHVAAEYVEAVTLLAR